MYWKRADFVFLGLNPHIRQCNNDLRVYNLHCIGFYKKSREDLKYMRAYSYVLYHYFGILCMGLLNIHFGVCMYVYPT